MATLDTFSRKGTTIAGKRHNHALGHGTTLVPPPPTDAT